MWGRALGLCAALLLVVPETAHADWLKKLQNGWSVLSIPPGSGPSTLYCVAKKDIDTRYGTDIVSIHRFIKNDRLMISLQTHGSVWGLSSRGSKTGSLTMQLSARNGASLANAAKAFQVVQDNMMTFDIDRGELQSIEAADLMRIKIAEQGLDLQFDLRGGRAAVQDMNLCHNSLSSQAPTVPLVQVLGNGRWAVGNASNCNVPAQSYFMTAGSGSITWTSGTGNIDEEAITYDGANELRSSTSRSVRVSGQPSPRGKTWTYSKVDANQVRVVPSTGNPFLLVKCAR